jgi:hypothetical protein
MPLSKDEKKELIQIINLLEKKRNKKGEIQKQKRNKKGETQKRKPSSELKSPRISPGREKYVNELQRNIAKQYEKN